MGGVLAADYGTDVVGRVDEGNLQAVVTWEADGVMFE
jgi:hypothetical protein